jgi:hypothetical protein
MEMKRALPFFVALASAAAFGGGCTALLKEV